MISPVHKDRPQVILAEVTEAEEIASRQPTPLAGRRGKGTLLVLPEGFGFLRLPERSYLSSPDDIYVSPAQIRRFGLRTGMAVEGVVRPPLDGQQSLALLQVETVDGDDPESLAGRVDFEDLTPLHPNERLVLEAG